MKYDLLATLRISANPKTCGNCRFSQWRYCPVFKAKLKKTPRMANLRCQACLSNATEVKS